VVGSTSWFDRNCGSRGGKKKSRFCTACDVCWKKRIVSFVFLSNKSNVVKIKLLQLLLATFLFNQRQHSVGPLRDGREEDDVVQKRSVALEQRLPRGSGASCICEKQRLETGFSLS
jgi:hypothetical protein